MHVPANSTLPPVKTQKKKLAAGKQETEEQGSHSWGDCRPPCVCASEQCLAACGKKGLSARKGEEECKMPDSLTDQKKIRKTTCSRRALESLR